MSVETKPLFRKAIPLFAVKREESHWEEDLEGSISFSLSESGDSVEREEFGNGEDDSSVTVSDS